MNPFAATSRRKGLAGGETGERKGDEGAIMLGEGERGRPAAGSGDRGGEREREGEFVAAVAVVFVAVAAGEA